MINAFSKILMSRIVANVLLTGVFIDSNMLPPFFSSPSARNEATDANRENAVERVVIDTCPGSILKRMPIDC